MPFLYKAPAMTKNNQLFKENFLLWLEEKSTGIVPSVKKSNIPRIQHLLLHHKQFSIREVLMNTGRHLPCFQLAEVICHSMLFTKSINNDKIKFLEQQHPSCYSTCQHWFLYQIEQSLMIYMKHNFVAKQIVPKLL